jgi:hypothetical protein
MEGNAKTVKRISVATVKYLINFDRAPPSRRFINYTAKEKLVNR